MSQQIDIYNLLFGYKRQMKCTAFAKMMSQENKLKYRTFLENSVAQFRKNSCDVCTYSLLVNRNRLYSKYNT